MKNKKMNNKGFSLVELIIVIAIMAVLIGVLAPQFLKFVERSRKSTDVQNVAEICRAIEIYAADPMADEAPADGTLSLTTTLTAVSTAGSNDFIKDALDEAGIDEVGLKSSGWAATGTSLTLSVDAQDDGTVDFSITTTQATDHDILAGEYK